MEYKLNIDKVKRILKDTCLDCRKPLVLGINYSGWNAFNYDDGVLITSPICDNCTKCDSGEKSDEYNQQGTTKGKRANTMSFCNGCIHLDLIFDSDNEVVFSNGDRTVLHYYCKKDGGEIPREYNTQLVISPKWCPGREQYKESEQT